MAQAGSLLLMPLIMVIVGFAVAVPGIKWILASVEIFSSIEELKSAYDAKKGQMTPDYRTGFIIQMINQDPEKQGHDPNHDPCRYRGWLLFPCPGHHEQYRVCFSRVTIRDDHAQLSSDSFCTPFAWHSNGKSPLLVLFQEVYIGLGFASFRDFPV